MEKKKLSGILRKKKRKRRKTKDPCFICEKELFFNNKFSLRIGVVDKGEVEGWICPHCRSEFDLKNNILYIYGQDYAKGDA